MNLDGKSKSVACSGKSEDNQLSVKPVCLIYPIRCVTDQIAGPSTPSFFVVIIKSSGRPFKAFSPKDFGFSKRFLVWNVLSSFTRDD